MNIPVCPLLSHFVGAGFVPPRVPSSEMGQRSANPEPVEGVRMSAIVLLSLEGED